MLDSMKEQIICRVQPQQTKLIRKVWMAESDEESYQPQFPLCINIYFHTTVNLKYHLKCLNLLNESRT